MKFIIGLVVLLTISISSSALALSKGKEHDDPIVFEIVSEDVVEVNGVEASIDEAWVEASKSIDPEEVNLYEIKNASEYPKQADVIIRHMNIVSEGSGVEVEKAQ